MALLRLQEHWLGLLVTCLQKPVVGWSLKGDAGTRFCGLCKNVFSHSEDDGGVSEVTRWTSFGQLQLTESEEVFASWDRMAGRWSTCSAGEFKRWQQAADITFSPEAVLADRTLRDVLDPCRQYKHDWMHCLCSNGILSIGIYCLMEEMDCWQNFGDYVGLWAIPGQWKQCGINVQKLFTNERVQKHRKGTKFSCTASELITVLPILVHYIKKVCVEHMVKEAECIQVLAHLVDLLQATWPMSVEPEAIQRASEKGWHRLESHQEAPLVVAFGAGVQSPPCHGGMLDNGKKAWICVTNWQCYCQYQQAGTECDGRSCSQRVTCPDW